MTDELAEETYNVYMLSLSKGAWKGTWSALAPETRDAWRAVVSHLSGMK